LFRLLFILFSTKCDRKQKSGSRLLIRLMFSLKAERASRATLDLYSLAGRVQGASHGAGAIFFIAPLREGWGEATIREHSPNHRVERRQLRELWRAHGRSERMRVQPPDPSSPWSATRIGVTFSLVRVPP
jgi:hypothetical protein